MNTNKVVATVEHEIKVGDLGRLVNLSSFLNVIVTRLCTIDGLQSGPLKSIALEQVKNPVYKMVDRGTVWVIAKEFNVEAGKPNPYSTMEIIYPLERFIQLFVPLVRVDGDYDYKDVPISDLEINTF